MKKLLIATIIAGVWSSLSSMAVATCDRSAQVVRVTANPGTTTSLIYYRDNALSNFYWVCTTTDAKLLDAALTAQISSTRTQIRGDVAACPATSATTTGQVSAGNCVLVVINP